MNRELGGNEPTAEDARHEDIKNSTRRRLGALSKDRFYKPEELANFFDIRENEFGFLMRYLNEAADFEVAVDPNTQTSTYKFIGKKKLPSKSRPPRSPEQFKQAINLTDSEKKLFNLVVAGRDNLEISEATKTTLGTVKVKKSLLLGKFGVSGNDENYRTNLLDLARKVGMVKEGSDQIE